MAKGGSGSATMGLERQEIAGEYRRFVADFGGGVGAGTGDPDQAASLVNTNRPVESRMR